jgi:hypothetical protein
MKEWEKLHRVDSEIARRICFCVFDFTGVLPFNEGVFSQVVVSGLERSLHSQEFEKSYRKAYEMLIIRLSNCLKPGGELCVFVENTSLKTFVKKRRATGFLLWAILTLKHHKFLIQSVLYFYPALGNVSVMSDKRHNSRRSSKIKEQVNHLLKSEGAMIFCRKPGDREYVSVAEQIVTKIETECGHHNAGVLRLMKGSGGSFVLQTNSAIVRLPRLWRSENVARWSNNFEALIGLHNIALSFKIPEVYIKGKMSGQPFSIESRLSGKSDNGKKPSYLSGKSLQVQAIDCLIELFKSTSSVSTLLETDFLRLFSDPINSATRHFNKVETKTLWKLNDWLRAEFVDREIPLVTTHGDFKRSNLLLNERGTISGVFDWDLSRSLGLPILDLFLFLGFETEEVDFSTRIMNEFIDKSPLGNPLVLHYIQNTYDLPELRLKGLALLTIIYYLAYHCTTLERTAKTRNNLEAVIMRATELAKITP